MENKKIEEQENIYEGITFSDELIDNIYGERGEELREEFEKSFLEYKNRKK